MSGAARYYSSAAQPTALSSGLSSVSPVTTGQSVTVAAVTGFPVSYPFTLLIDWGTASQEVLTVTQAATGSGPYTFANCTRGDDGTSAPSHIAGAAVVHGVSARDYADPQAHINGFLQGMAPVGITGATEGSRYVGATSSGAPVSGTFAVGDFVVDRTGAIWICTTAGTPGTWVQSGLPVAGGTLAGPLVINDVPSGSPGSLPVGYGDSEALTGLQIASSYPSDDVSDGTDGTGRISLYSYQRANTYSFGETIRNFLMRWDAKAMHAWYGPVDLYDGSGNAIQTAGWKPWTWIGSHYEANNDLSIHGHWEVEIPDTTGALQGRLIVPFIDDNPASGTYGEIGVTTTNIQLSQSYLTMICGTTGGAIRIAGPAGDVNRVLEFANSQYVTTSSARWQVFADNTAESGGNAGSNFQIASFSDTATAIGTPLQITRATGLVTLGYSAEVTANLGIGTTPSSTLRLSVLNSVSSGQLAQFTRTSTSDTSPVVVVLAGDTSTAQALGISVNGDSSNRFGVDPTGKITWGSGSASRDTTLNRSGVNYLSTSGYFSVADNLVIGSTGNSLSSGLVGGIAIANVGTAPASTPSGGGVLYVSAGALVYKGSSGTVTTIATA